MNTIINNLPIVLAALIVCLVAFLLATRSKLKPLFVFIGGASSSFSLCFLMWKGASLKELSLSLLAFLLLGYIFHDKRRNEKK